jgi:iron(III) transport system permease protein
MIIILIYRSNANHSHSQLVQRDNWRFEDMAKLAADNLTRMRPHTGLNWSQWIRRFAIAISILCGLPLVMVVFAAFSANTETLDHLASTVLTGYVITTLELATLVAIGTFFIGVTLAWLVTACSFPGRRFFQLALVLPLAFPAYILAYAYTHVFDHPGIVQSSLRKTFDLGPKEYWFPEIRSLEGAALMLTLVLYPYVYLLARAAFLQQGLRGFETARVLGKRPLAAFLSVTLPMARPAIAGGVLLAVMETLADFGTVSFFGVQTFATGIYTSWFSMGDRNAAAQLAVGLLCFALFLVLLERLTRSKDSSYNKIGISSSPPPIQLTGKAALAAWILCSIPVIFGFVGPAVTLLIMAINSFQDFLRPRYLGFMANSVILAAVASLITVAAATIFGICRRADPSHRLSTLTATARLGYAVPGGVIAVGLLIPFAAFDNAFDAWMRSTFNISTGLILTGSITLLVLAYMIRFLAAAMNAFDAGEVTISKNIDAAASTLGHTQISILRRVHLPLLAPSLLTAMLIVFVDVLKELPATLILRPFNWDTLAVQAHRLAADERLYEAAVPSLVILCIGLLPVYLLCRQIGKSP